MRVLGVAPGVSLPLGRPGVSSHRLFEGVCAGVCPGVYEKRNKENEIKNTAIGHKAEALVTRQHQTGAGGVAPFALGFKEPSSPAEINGRQEKGYFCVMLLPSLLSCLI